MTSPGWYLRRLSRMSPQEVAGRVRTRWRIGRLRRSPACRGLSEGVSGTFGGPVGDFAGVLPTRRFPTGLSGDVLGAIPAAATARLVATADRLLEGHADFFGITRRDLVAPDWSFDPKTGRRAPGDEYAFDIDYRDEQAVGDIKQVWELSRHHHLTILAAAFALTGDDRYARRIADHLKSWWAANPPLRGVHWVSGIELGIRLLSWVWVRRLLDPWREVSGLFEDNPDALHQISEHQRWLAKFPSIGSSANNHVIAEAAGRLAAACAFDWYPESSAWREDAGRRLAEELQRNTFGSGLNRELATEYHGLVLELGLVAAAEADAAGHPLPDPIWPVLVRMSDALAAIVDVDLRPPRQGDADDGHGLVVDGAGTDRWASLLATGDALFGRLPWWPEVPQDAVRTPLLAALARPPAAPDRPASRPWHFADAGLTLLRAPRTDDHGELWCRCDGGPHGFLSIAAHAHADALALEVRHDGVEILTDPGTYCYHGEPEWRRYFRSTLGHNTLELDGEDQSTSGGPFMWTRHARSRVLAAATPDSGVARWRAEHDGYARRGRPVVHRRTVELDIDERELRVLDEVVSRQHQSCRLAWHLGPSVHVELDDRCATLAWPSGRGARSAALQLPAGLSWSVHRGETDPPLGWYSPGFGRREPACTLIGSGTVGGSAAPLVTSLQFRSADESRMVRR